MVHPADLVCQGKIWPPLMAAVDARNKKIADGLAEAEKGKWRWPKAKSKRP